MKKVLCVLALAVLVIGAVSAQGWGAPAESVRVEGTLQLRNGQIALVAGNAVYFVPVLARYIGFIDGLREGAQVTVEGFVFNNILQPATLSIGGREFDFTAQAQGGAYGHCGFGPAGGCPRGGYGGGYHRGAGRRRW